MLILTRKKGERIIIDDDIEVMIVGIHGTQVRLGITAPQEVEVHREEVYDRIQAEGNHRGKGLVSAELTQAEVDTLLSKKRGGMYDTDED